MLLPLLGNASSTPSRIPPWFDSIQRLPIRSLLVSGQRIAFLDSGEGPPVVLVHGFGGSMWQWEYQQTALSTAHRVVTLDLLGAGLSDKPDIRYTPTDLVEFFRGFMDALGIRRASLVGNSMGAGLAIGMALTHPDLVDRLVLIGGFPDHVREKLASPLIEHAVDSRVPAWLASLGNRFVGRGLTRTLLHELVHDRSRLTPAVLDRSNHNRKIPGLVQALISLRANLPLWEDGFARRLGELRHRTLIVWGAEDRLFPSQVGRDLHDVIIGSTFRLIPEAGHLPQWEQPDAVNPILLQFLQP